MVKSLVLILIMLTILGFVSIGLLQLGCKGEVAQEFSPDSLIHEALQVSGNISDAISRSRAFCRIANELMEAGRKEQARSVLKQALDAAIGIEDGVRRSRTLCEVATQMVKLGMKDQAITAFKQAMKSAEKHPRETERVWAQHDVALQMAKVGFFDDAVRAAKEIRNDRVRSVTICNIVSRAMVEAGLFERALEVAESIELLYWRFRALVNVATRMAKIGQKDKAIEIWKQVLRLSQGFDKWEHDSIFREIALSMAEIGLFDQAIKVAGEIEGEEYRSLSYADIAVKMARIGNEQMARILSDRALRTAMGIEEINYRLAALSSVAFTLADAGFYDLALRTAKSAKNEPIVRVRIIENMAKGRKFEEALKTARAIDKPLLRLSTLSIIASEMIRATMKQQASQVIDELLKIPKDSIRDVGAVRNLREVIEVLAKAGMRERAKEVFEFAVQLARDIEPERYSSIYERAFPEVVVASLISTMAEVGFIDEALKAIEYLAKPKCLTSKEVYPQVMHCICVKMAKTGKIQQASELAHSIADPFYKAISLAAIARILICEKTKHSGTQ